MKRFFCLFFLCFPVFAYAQATSVAVDITKAKMTWGWDKGTGGDAAGFNVKCGTTSGSYTIVVPLTDPAARSIPVSQVISATGKYFCVITAVNQFGESAPSNEISFDAGTVPVPPAGLTIQMQ
jgi:hypothetical protein